MTSRARTRKSRELRPAAPVQRLWRHRRGRGIEGVVGGWRLARRSHRALQTPASADKTARIWNPDAGNLIATLRGHESRVSYVVYSPDGTRLATSSADHTAKIWDAHTGELLVDLTDRIGLAQPNDSIARRVTPARLADSTDGPPLYRQLGQDRRANPCASVHARIRTLQMPSNDAFLA